jgi:hypothetical protein
LELQELEDEWHRRNRELRRGEIGDGGKGQAREGFTTQRTMWKRRIRFETREKAPSIELAKSGRAKRIEATSALVRTIIRRISTCSWLSFISSRNLMNHSILPVRLSSRRTEASVSKSLRNVEKTVR